MLNSLFGILIFCISLCSFFARAEAPLKNYTLKDQNGKSFQLTDLKGSYLFVSFIYTRCPLPKMCPLTMSLNRRLFTAWKKSASTVPLKFLIVTLDPNQDSPSVLKRYGKKFNLNEAYFTLATGPDQVLSDFSAEFNAIGLPSNGLMAHNSKSVLLGPLLTPLKDYKENEWAPEEVIKDLLSFHANKEKKT